MRKLLPLLLLILTGCSNAPLAGFLDTVVPSRGQSVQPPRDYLP